jgi:hypothetical protein
MSNVGKRDLFVLIVLAFDFLVAVPAGKYPLWTVHSELLRVELYAAFWAGVISAVGLPVWIGIRLRHEPKGRRLKIVELVGALCWILAIGYLVVSVFPII